VNKAELDYIESKEERELEAAATAASVKEKTIPLKKCFTFKQTWAFAVGKFMTDGVWWFFLFWAPDYIDSQFGITYKNPETKWLYMGLLFTLYAIITVLSICGSKLPAFFMNRDKDNPYKARMRAMLLFAFVPIGVLLVQPLVYLFEPSMGKNVAWIAVVLIALGGSAHQAWSANLFSTVGDMFPKATIAFVTGIGGMAGGIGSFILQRSAGNLFKYAGATNMPFLGFEGKPAGYFIIFCFCAVAYLVGWTIMKALVPKYKPITESEY